MREMSKLIILVAIFLLATFITSPLVISAEEPFVIDDFETGLGKWYGSGGGGAVNGMLKETKDGAVLSCDIVGLRRCINVD
jgi:hypothetical protein